LALGFSPPTIAIGFALLVLPMFISPVARAGERAPDASWGDGPANFSVAAGSFGETGMLERLSSEFVDENKARLNWYKAGSGAALEMLHRGEVDMVLVHDPAAESAAVANGWATGRVLIGSNEFWIVGPKDDPAGVGVATSLSDALRRIEKSGARFLSRGDSSGTHQREISLWKAAGIAPAGSWYVVTQDFMTASLRRADAEGAYFLTDSSTFIVERKTLANLKVLRRGDKELTNPYHLLYSKAPTAGAATARKFGEFILSERGQEVMGKYGKGRYGDPLYFNAARTTE
jgi:tungstate transport system substrate-binding protein